MPEQNLEDEHALFVAEFDSVADAYEEQHRANIAFSGDGPEYFAEYKIVDLAKIIANHAVPSGSIFDFGSGIGNSIPFFRKHIGHARLTCGDVSARSLAIARQRFSGDEAYVLLNETIPLPTASQDVVFSACVFHHIPHEQHAHWLGELLRLVRPGGLLVIFEHNPFNPLTVRAVNTCPFDANARLVSPGAMRRRALEAGWSKARIDYRLFFPSALQVLRVAEPYLSRIPLGGQYRLTSWRMA
jgi:SAM-dependent methyltransferase